MQDTMQSPENVIPFLKQTEPSLTILAVEDDRLERAFLQSHIEALGHKMIEATDGQMALDILKTQGGDIDIILMDRMMPGIDGLTAVKRIKEDRKLRKIPVIMVTGASDATHMQEGIEAGVFYYLGKPVDASMLKSVLSAAAREAQQNRALQNEMLKHRSNFHLIETCKFRFSSITQAESLAAFIAQCFPEPARVLPGLAELMINAVEHGICDIGYESKSMLLESGTLRAEIDRRQQMAPYNTMSVEAVVTRREDGVYAIITDPGKGFEWQRFMRIEPSRAMDNHGRGIAQANALSFDKLTYNEAGNQAVGYVSKVERLDW